MILKKLCNVLFGNQGACLHFAVDLTWRGMRHNEYIRTILWDSLIFLPQKQKNHFKIPALSIGEVKLLQMGFDQ